MLIKSLTHQIMEQHKIDRCLQKQTKKSYWSYERLIMTELVAL